MGHECADPDDAHVADAYGQWADRLYASIAVLLVPVAIGDFVVWLTGGSLMSLLGPAGLLGLCIAYLHRRRQFRRSVRAGRSQTPHASMAGRWKQMDSHPLAASGQQPLLH